MATRKGTRTIARSSMTGRIVTKKYAKSHPSTTEIERVKVPGKRSTKKK